jgi:hypothetical protein
VNGTNLSAAIQNDTASGSAEVWNGVVSSGSGSQTVTVNWASGSSAIRGFSLRIATRLSSCSAPHTATGSGTSTTINVTSGDFLFVGGFNGSTGANYNSSTQTPSNLCSPNCNPGSTFISFADWTIASTNSSFTIAYSVNSEVAAATFR